MDELRATPAAILEQQHFTAITTAIQELLDLTKPRSTLIIAIDAPIALAKAYQQKQRRFKARSALVGEEDGYQLYDTTRYVASGIFDSNTITPGTPFMDRLDQYLQSWIQSNRARLPPRVVFSGSRSIEEGEHKLSHYLRTLQWDPRYERSHVHVIYGLDADLIFLSLLLPLSNVALLRDDVSFKDGEHFHLLNIPETRRAVKDGIGSVDDFLLLSTLVGNDFIPSFPSVSVGDLDKLIEVYRRANVYLTYRDTHRVNWSAFTSFLAVFVSEEQVLLEEQASRGARYPSVALQGSIVNGFLDLAKFSELHYERALSARTPEVRRRMAESWLAAVAWVYMYYNEGMSSINSDWFYPFNYVPLAAEILEVLTTDKERAFEWFAIDTRSRALLPFEQLVAVLPPASAHLLPESLRFLITSEQSPLADLYPTTFRADLNGKMKEHEAVALLPFIDGERVRAAVKAVLAEFPLTEEEERRNSVEGDRVFKQYQL